MPYTSKAQQRFMYATMPKTAKKWAHETPNIKKLPQHVKNEGIMEEHFDHPGCEDTVGKIFVVLKPHPETTPEDLVHSTHAFGMNQYDPQGIHGIYNDEEEANMVAEAAHKQLHKHLKLVEKKKDDILEKINHHISRLQKEVNGHMKEAAENPELTEEHHDLAERKMTRIRDLHAKRKMVEASKKELPKDPLKENSPAPSKPKPNPTIAPGKPVQKPGPRRPLGNPEVRPKPKAQISENEDQILDKIVKRYQDLKNSRKNG